MKYPFGSASIRHKIFIVIVALFLVGCSKGPYKPFPTPTIASMSEQEAIDIAIYHCDLGHLQAQESPHNIQADLTTLDNALRILADDNYHGRDPELMVWLITMEGTWLLFGPPPVAGTPTPEPPQFHHCAVIITATTGELISVSNRQRH